MALQSMTGFARSDGADGSLAWTWELRSVNGKGLDLRLRLPQGYDRLEAELRRRLAARLARGNVQATLTVSGDRTAATPVINEEALAAVLGLVERVRGQVDASPPSVDGLLAIRGVIDYREDVEDGESREARDAAILADFDRAADALVAMRSEEGAALAAVLAVQLDTIAALAKTIEDDPSRSPEAIRERLSGQIALIVGERGLDRDRLHMEAALLATKADLREEIDRLHAHVAAARQLIAGDGPVGRRLDFLSQEFNREANTVCSKSNAASVTACGMELKIVIDQIREQVQNLE